MAATGKCDFSSTGFEVCLLIRFWWSYNCLINTPYLLTRFEPLIMTPRFVTSLVWEVWGTTSWNTNSHSAETFENIKFAEDNNQLPRTAPIRTSTDVHIHKVLRFKKVHLKIIYCAGKPLPEKIFEFQLNVPSLILVAFGISILLSSLKTSENNFEKAFFVSPVGVRKQPSLPL